MNKLIIPLLLTTVTILTGFTSNETDALTGVWIRKSDHLRIKVEAQDKEKLFSFIVEEGDEKFPCDVNAMPIYKNIVKAGRNLWRCDFLVVTMGSCTTEYEEGIIRMMNNGDIEITCPGFEKKYYSKLKPRIGVESNAMEEK